MKWICWNCVGKIPCKLNDNLKNEELEISRKVSFFPPRRYFIFNERTITGDLLQLFIFKIIVKLARYFTDTIPAYPFHFRTP
jgi:hypothetical protein